jgi:hypothetical protein
LTNGTTYYYRVAAVNDNGEGVWSDVQSEYPSTVPNAPTISCLENSNSQGNGQQLTIRWHQNPTDVCRNGGSAIIQFDIRDGDNNLLGSVMASNGTSHYSYVINNLINGQSYSFNVSAENRDGEGSSASSTSEIPSGLPDAPSGLIVDNVNALNDGHQALISVDALNVASGGINIAPSDEGSEFDHFVVYRDGNPVGTMTDTFTDTGLVNGQSYSYTVSAVNDNGEGAQCSPVTFVASCKPDAVSGLSAVHGNGQVQLSWNLLAVAPSESPSDEGSVITRYDVYKQELGVWSQIATLASNASSYMATGLVNGRSYDFKISATNANGMSDYSEVVSAAPSTSPSAVRNVHIVGNASELQIIWDQPLSSGGLSYLYSLEVTDVDGGVAYQASALNTRYVEVQNLSTNVQYIVSIYAYNTVDTNYIIYSTQATTVPTPIEITSLEWDNTHATQSIMKWNYASDIFAAIDFLLVSWMLQLVFSVLCLYQLTMLYKVKP